MLKTIRNIALGSILAVSVSGVAMANPHDTAMNDMQMHMQQHMAQMKQDWGKMSESMKGKKMTPQMMKGIKTMIWDMQVMQKSMMQMHDKMMHMHMAMMKMNTEMMDMCMKMCMDMMKDMGKMGKN